MLGSRNNSKATAKPSIDDTLDTFVAPAPAASQRVENVTPESAVISTARTTEPQTTAVIGPKIRFKGELVGEEDLIIQGQVDGTINLKGNSLTIGKQGSIKANVLAKTITIEGSIEGDIFGQERISVLSSSNVKGNLVADRVTLEDGAKFRGSIDMDIESRSQDFEKFGAGLTLSSPDPSKAENAKRSEKNESSHATTPLEEAVAG